jgi:hypothetical protein
VMVRPGGAPKTLFWLRGGPRYRDRGPTGQNMDENSGPARRDRIGAPLAGWRSEKPRGLLFLLLMTLAGNIVVATLAWFLVGLFLR